MLEKRRRLESSYPFIQRFSMERIAINIGQTFETEDIVHTVWESSSTSMFTELLEHLDEALQVPQFHLETYHRYHLLNTIQGLTTI